MQSVPPIFGLALLAVVATACAAGPLELLRERRQQTGGPADPGDGAGGFLDSFSNTPPHAGAIDPGATASNIPAGEANQGDWEVALAPAGRDNGRLVIFFPGSGANPGGYMKIMETWAGAGYHVLGVTLKAEAAGLNRNCPPAKRTSEPQCFDAFRAESAFGANVALPDGAPGQDSPYLTVNAGKSAVNRTFALLDYAIRTRGGENWAQFRKVPCAKLPSSAFCPPDWNKITITGHSQGGGLALYFAKYFSLAGVGMISAPQDFWVVGDRVEPAAWVATGRFATPTDRIIGLVHKREAEYDRDVKSWRVLGMKGTLVDASAGSARLATTQTIATDIAPTCKGIAAFQMSIAAHGATSFDKCTSDALSPAWLRVVALP